MRVVVAGGTGFLGRRTVDALRRFPGIEVEVASRRGPRLLDLSQPGTFTSLADADVVVDLTDGTRSRPDALAAWCLAQGKMLVEATSDAETIRRLVDAQRDATGPGRLVLGGGLFTGVSNLMARQVSDAVGPGGALTFAVASSPYSGAGGGTIALMVEAAARPAVRTVGGVRREEPPALGPRVTFGGRSRPTFRTSLAEAEMLPASTGAADVETLFAFKPGFLVHLFAALPPALLRAKWFRALLGLNFTFLRRFLLSGVPTAVELVATAARDGRDARCEVDCTDGMEACAWALAGQVEALGRTPPRPGLSYIDDTVRLAPLVERVNEVAGRSVLRILTPAAPGQAG